MTRLLLTAAALASLVSLAGAAHAQTSLTSAVFATPRVSIAPQVAQAAALRQAGIARTSVDHSFAGKATASLGFLCGLQPRADEAIGSAHGFDSQGRFLGAKLSFAFR
jgi:opacity protein-like surface antigen